MLFGHPAHLLLEAGMLACFDGKDEDAEGPLALMHVDDRDVSMDRLTVAPGEGDVVHAGGDVPSLHILDAGPQALHTVADVEIAKLATDSAGARDLEELPGRDIPEQDGVGEVDERHGGRKSVDRPLDAGRGIEYFEAAARLGGGGLRSPLGEN